MKIYMVVGSSGQWDDYYEWVEKGFFSAVDAQAFIDDGGSRPSDWLQAKYKKEIDESWSYVSELQTYNDEEIDDIHNKLLEEINLKYKKDYPNKVFDYYEDFHGYKIKELEVK